MPQRPIPQSEWIKVKTTLPSLPLPLNSTRPPVTTDRLLLRALVPEDVHALHIIRTQPEVMINNPTGRPDKDVEDTKPRLAVFLPPNDAKTYNFAICLKETGEMIGMGGCHRMAAIFGWPVLGYQLRKEYWGRGLATEFSRAWLEMWCKLPREEVEVVVDPRTVVGVETGDGRVKELMSSWTLDDNLGSQRVLEKAGFERFLVQREPDLRDPSVEVDLLIYRFSCE
ncbi:hypothetical protein OQA88_8438 [Cercophora sp. LCS_1]